MRSLISCIIFSAFIFASLFVLKNHINNFNTQKNEIDLLEEVLPPLSKYFPNKKEIIFNSSCVDGNLNVLYYKSQFAMAPRFILKNQPVQSGDTVLMIENDCARDTTKLQSFNEILTVNRGSLKIKICVKK